ncbi:MAG: hypothetical protein KUG82_11285 [Pseudomonadales bacterium]|nr:hypothetical protein [Pseudomonadales bacterium]
MRVVRYFLNTAVLLLLFSTSITFAVGIKDVRINGFLSQGFLKSSDNDYFKDTKNGTWNFSEVGLSFVVPMEDNLYFGVQFFSQQLAGEGESAPTIDWAFLDYSAESWLGFRVGKIKLPFGLYNKQRDVDYLRTSVLLPQAVYMENLREFLVAIQGIELYGNIDFSKFGYLDYELFVGTLDMDANSGYINNSFGLMRVDFLGRGLNLDEVMQAAQVSLSELEVTFQHLEGFGAVWSITPELRVGQTWMQAMITAVIEGFIDTEIKLAQMSVSSIEYDKGPLTLAYEYLLLRTDSIDTLFEATEFETEGWYAGFSWQFTGNLSVAISYGESFSLGGEGKAGFFTSKGLPDYLAWQKEFTYSVSYEVTENSLIKAEVKRIHGVGLSLPFEINIVPKDSWSLYSVKASIAF